MKKYILIITFPFLIGLICATILYFYLSDGLVLERLEFVLNAIITCSVTISGFILTSVSILIGLSSSPIMVDLKNNGGLDELQIRYTESLVVGVLLIIFCVIMGAGADVDEENMIQKCWVLSGAMLIVSYFISISTTSYYLLKVINNVPNTNEIQEDKNPGIPEGNFRI